MRKLMVVWSALLCAWTVGADAAKLYKWMDKDGNVSYQDSPPPPGMGRVEEKNVRTRSSSGDSAIDAAAAQAPVIMYSSPKCAPCDIARAYLNKRNIPFTEKNASSDVKVQEELRQKTGGALQVPTIVIGSKVIGEYSQAWLESELDQAGYPKAGGAGEQPAEAPPQ